MPTTHIFSHFAEEKGVQLSAFGSVFRKIGHFTSNKATSFWQTSSKADKAVAGVEIVSGVGGVMGLGPLSGSQKLRLRPLGQLVLLLL